MVSVKGKIVLENPKYVEGRMPPGDQEIIIEFDDATLDIDFGYDELVAGYERETYYNGKRKIRITASVGCGVYDPICFREDTILKTIVSFNDSTHGNKK